MWWLILIYLGKHGTNLARTLRITMLVCTHYRAIKDISHLLILCFYKVAISVAYLWLSPCVFPFKKRSREGVNLSWFSWYQLFGHPVDMTQGDNH